MINFEKYTEQVKKDPRFWDLVEIVRGYETYGQVLRFLDGAREESVTWYLIARTAVSCAFGY